MKKFFNIPLLITVLAGVLVVNARAQTSNAQRVIASIPFAFNAGKATLPAGKYTITVLNPTSDRKILQIRSMNGRSSATVLTTASSAKVSDGARLVFERVGNGYVFAQAQMASDEITLAAVRSKANRGDKHVAKAAEKRLVVIVAE